MKIHAARTRFGVTDPFQAPLGDRLLPSDSIDFFEGGTESLLGEEELTVVELCARARALSGINGEALDLLPRVLVDARRALGGAIQPDKPSPHDLAEVGEAMLPLLRALGGGISE